MYPGDELRRSLEATHLLGDACLVLTTDPKPRLRWSAELHERFVDAVNQLGGPEKATPKTIMKTMGVKGITLYHLKSHLQKYRLGMQSCKEVAENPKDGSDSAESLGNGRSSSSRTMAQESNDGCNEAMKAQMELQKKLHEHLEVQHRLQLRIEAQGKYLQSILKRACVVLSQTTITGSRIAAARNEFSDFENLVCDDRSSFSNEPPKYPFPSNSAACLEEKAMNGLTRIGESSVESSQTSKEGLGIFPNFGSESALKKRPRLTFGDGESYGWEGDIWRGM